VLSLGRKGTDCREERQFGIRQAPQNDVLNGRFRRFEQKVTSLSRPIINAAYEPPSTILTIPEDIPRNPAIDRIDGFQFVIESSPNDVATNTLAIPVSAGFFSRNVGRRSSLPLCPAPTYASGYTLA
jgi:hypothetical protein